MNERTSQRSRRAAEYSARHAAPAAKPLRLTPAAASMRRRPRLCPQARASSAQRTAARRTHSNANKPVRTPLDARRKLLTLARSLSGMCIASMRWLILSGILPGESNRRYAPRSGHPALRWDTIPTPGPVRYANAGLRIIGRFAPCRLSVTRIHATRRFTRRGIRAAANPSSQRTRCSARGFTSNA